MRGGRTAVLGGLVVGYGVMAFGVIGLVQHASLDRALQVALWVGGVDVLHDLVLAPIVCLVGLAIARVAPPAWRWPLLGGAIGTAIVVAVSYPALRGFGRDTAPGNSTVLPLNYGTAVLTVLAIVWAIAIAAGLVAMIASRRPRGRL
jgi:hypothetical protein